MNDSKKEERLNKYLADCGICSRREADRMIEAGRVIVNGVPAQMGMRISETDDITVDGRPLDKKDRKVVLAYYKPVGVTCTEKDKYAEKTIRDAIDYPIRVTYAGRLDKDSEGLLLLTNDGDLINGLMRAANYHEKEYLVRVTQGLNRQIRRMCRALGFDAQGIKRVRVANITIGKLKPGNYRLLTAEELDELYGQLNS